MAHLLLALGRTPGWVDACMRLRNRLGGLVGLKDLGVLAAASLDRPAADYRPGERVGIFTVIENAPDEALVGDDDKHLKVVLSIHRGAVSDQGRRIVTVSTIVHVKNSLGRFYMLPVRPMHRLIAPAVIRQMLD